MTGHGEVTLRVNLEEFDRAVREAVEQLDDETLDRLADMVTYRVAQRLAEQAGP